ncbi:Plasma kallikrein [Halotydeus destructor]|nr:Plasma kallikrein [Halotydeus destructor]
MLFNSSFVLLVCVCSLVSCSDFLDLARGIPLIDSSHACDGIPLEVSEPFGYITQKGYDNTGLYPYPDNLKCTWVLTAPEGMVFWIQTVDMDMESDCRGYVELVDGGTGHSLTRFCGRRTRQYISPGNVLKIRFVGREESDGVPQAAGVKLYFETTLPRIQCDDGDTSCRHRKRCFTKKETCDGIDQCGDGTDEEGCAPSGKQLAFQENCGQPAIEPKVPRFSFKIVGGTAARPKSWPWQVSMRITGNEPDGHLCAATVIDGQWLLTAAHCFYENRDRRSWTLHFSKYNKLVRDEGEVVRYIDKLITHPDFVGGHVNDDIALIKLNAYLPGDNDGISAICLPDGTEDSADMLTFITGWGETLGTGFSLVLKQTEVPIVAKQQCQEWLRDFDITDSMLCAGFKYGGHDTCKGDSGGPLFVKKQERWTLLGVTSAGSRCCGMCENDAGIYSRVASYTDWIKGQLALDEEERNGVE